MCKKGTHLGLAAYDSWPVALAYDAWWRAEVGAALLAEVGLAAYYS